MLWHMSALDPEPSPLSSGHPLKSVGMYFPSFELVTSSMLNVNGLVMCASSSRKVYTPDSHGWVVHQVLPRAHGRELLVRRGREVDLHASGVKLHLPNVRHVVRMQTQRQHLNF